MRYSTPGPYVEGRVVNVDSPDAATEPVDIETAFAQLDRLRIDHPDSTFQVEKRTVWVEEWKRA